MTESRERYLVFENFFKDLITHITSRKIEDQDNYDLWHRDKCQRLILLVFEQHNKKLYVGQAQKWINMTLKYLVALGNDRVKGIMLNYHHFHLPIDNIIQSRLNDMGIHKINSPWSQIDDYLEYINYQKQVRSKFAGQIPMDIEFRLFNE